MKIYIVKYETLENGLYKEGFSNKKNAVSKVSKVKRDNRNKLKNRRETDYVGIIKQPIIITQDFPISREGLIKAINYI